MKTKDQIEFIKGLISAHFDKDYRLLQVKDTNEHNAKREKQKQTRQVRIVMGVLAFICLSFGIRGFFHLEDYQYFLGTNALPADAKLIASGLTVFGIIFALIGLDPQLAMKVDSSDGFVKEFSREIEPNDDKFKEKTKNFLDNLSLYKSTFQKADQSAMGALTSLYSHVDLDESDDLNDKNEQDAQIPLGVNASISVLYGNDALYNLVLYGELTNQGQETENRVLAHKRFLALSDSLNKIDSYSVKPNDMSKYTQMKIDYGQEYGKLLKDLCHSYDMLCQREISAIINRSDNKYADLLPKDYRQKAADNFVKNI